MQIDACRHFRCLRGSVYIAAIYTAIRSHRPLTQSEQAWYHLPSYRPSNSAMRKQTGFGSIACQSTIRDIRMNPNAMSRLLLQPNC